MKLVVFKDAFSPPEEIDAAALAVVDSYGRVVALVRRITNHDIALHRAGDPELAELVRRFGLRPGEPLVAAADNPDFPRLLQRFGMEAAGPAAVPDRVRSYLPLGQREDDQ